MYVPIAPAFADSAGAPCFFVTIADEVEGHRVRPVGDLDLASRTSMYDACTRAEHRDVVVDLSDVHFMDCAGYGSLVAARHELERRGGSLDVRHASDEPLRLIRLLTDEYHAVLICVDRRAH